MVMYRIDDVQVRDAVTGEFRDELIGMPVKIVLRDTTTPAPIFDSVGDPIPDSKLYVTSVRTVPRFWIDVADPSDLYLDWLDEGTGARGNVDFDRVLRDAAKTASSEAALSRTAAEAAADAAEAAANTNLPTGGNTGQVLAKRSGVDRDVEWVTPSGGSGGGATTWDQIAGKPATYPASTHQHTLSQLSDMSGLGRQVAAAGDAQTIRGLIGAGTGNGTSNLTLGSGAAEAAPGNHGHAASSITFAPPSGMTATNVQDAIVQASQTGGGSGGGTNTVYVWKQSGGAYPALPSSKPAGVEEVAARGAQSPIQLSATIPSWIGAGPGKASLEYQYNPTLT